MQPEQREITIDELRKLCTDDTMVLTQHLSLRLRERGIQFEDVKQAIQSGEIIERYPEDYPYPSCLVLGITILRNPLHVVCGLGGGLIWVITAYNPSSDKWESDNTTRRGNQV